MGLRTIVLIGTLILGLLGLPAQAQQPKKVYRIGYLATGVGGPRYERFQRALRDLGYVEGENLVIESRSTKTEKKRLPALADELVRLEVDLLVTNSLRSARAAKNATGKIPIVFSSSPDPVAAGLVDSLARPGENLTGVTYFSTALASKRLELLKETIPKLSRVAVLWQPGNPGSERIWKETQLRAPGFGLMWSRS
jgi:putative tryptophan/tyrosine transport system substrate-binding protein